MQDCTQETTYMRPQLHKLIILYFALLVFPCQANAATVSSLGLFIGMTVPELSAVFKKGGNYMWNHHDSEDLGEVRETVSWSCNDTQNSYLDFKLTRGRVTSVYFTADLKGAEAAEVHLNNTFRCVGTRRWVDAARHTMWKMYLTNGNLQYHLELVRV